MGLSAHRGREERDVRKSKKTNVISSDMIVDTCCLEVECYQLGPTEPHGQRVVVGGVQSLASGVDPGQLQPIVLQEPLPLDLVDVFLCLGLGEG